MIVFLFEHLPVVAFVGGGGVAGAAVVVVFVGAVVVAIKDRTVYELVQQFTC